MINAQDNDNQLTFGGHLEVLRRMLFRIIGVVVAISILILVVKDTVWEVILAPSRWDFITYCYIEEILQYVGIDFHFDKFEVDLIATELSSQFMTHITTSIYLGCLIASPYILFELFLIFLFFIYSLWFAVLRFCGFKTAKQQTTNRDIYTF